MEKCPICSTHMKKGPVCHQCGADMTPLRHVLTQAREHSAAALDAFYREDFDAMLKHAMSTFSKRSTRDTGRILACAAMLTGNFNLAVKTWRLIKG